MSSWSITAYSAGGVGGQLALWSNGHLATGEIPGVVEHVPPFTTGMAASRCCGANDATCGPPPGASGSAWEARGSGSGYINCQWSYLQGGVAIDPLTDDLYTIDSAERAAMLVTLNPFGATPTVAPTSGATNTPIATPTATPTRTRVSPQSLRQPHEDSPRGRNPRVTRVQEAEW